MALRRSSPAERPRNAPRQGTSSGSFSNFLCSEVVMLLHLIWIKKLQILQKIAFLPLAIFLWQIPHEKLSEFVIYVGEMNQNDKT